MIICQNCSSKEMEGALFCSECGSLLVNQPKDATQSLPKTSLENELGKFPPPARQADVPRSHAQGAPSITLDFLDSGKSLTLSGKKEYSLGRISEGQPILPDLDLSPCDALTLGVSRMHALLKLKDAGLVIVDMGSANGTRINGQKIPAKVECQLNNGDIIALGKMRIRINYTV